MQVYEQKEVNAEGDGHQDSDVAGIDDARQLLGDDGSPRNLGDGIDRENSCEVDHGRLDVDCADLGNLDDDGGDLWCLDVEDVGVGVLRLF